MQLVGQHKLRAFIDGLTLENCPHFIILKGSKGCGKTYVTQLIAEKLGCLLVEFQPSVQQVKHIISTIYNIKEPCVYYCESLDKMHINAKNSLLKVTEETPKNAYIILQTLNTPMSTLNSRAQVLEFEPYSFLDYEEYCEEVGAELPQENADILMESCNSLAECVYQIQTGKFKETLELANKVLDYISEVSQVNAFKILSSLALKKEGEGLDPKFFLTVLLNLYVHREGKVEFGNIIVDETQKALQQLRVDVLSKKAIMNVWVLNMMRRLDAIC